MSLDDDLLARLGRTLQELVTVGGDAERSRAYLGVEVLANSGSATPPPTNFVQARIDGVAILCRYYGNEPVVGQFVDALSIQNSNPIIFQNHTTGLVGAGWPFDTETLTVDSTDPDADYAAIAPAIAALVAGNVIVISPEQFTCDGETLPANTDLEGWDKLRSILHTTQTTALTLAGANYLRDVQIHADGDDAGIVAAIDVNASNSELEHVIALAEQAGDGDAAGITVDGAANNILLTDVRARGVSSNGGNEYGLLVEAGGSVQRVQGGHFDGDSADVYVEAGAEVYLDGPVLEGGVVGGPGDAYGWYWDGAGDFYTVNSNIIMEDNLADALSFDDGGGLEYIRFDTRNAQPVVHFNAGEADVDFRVSASGITDALFVRGSDGFVGVGAIPDYRFSVYETFTGLVGATVGVYNVVNMAPGAASAASGFGFYGQLRSAAGNNENCTGSLALYRGTADWYSTGQLTALYGFWPSVVNRETGTIQLGVGVLGSVTQVKAGGQITTAYGLQAQVTETAGTIPTGIGLIVSRVQSTTVGYGIFIADAITGATQWGIYQAGATDKNYLAGDLGIGGVVPGSLTEWNFATENLEFVDAGSAGATEQDWIEVQVGNVQGFLRVYAAV